MRRVLRLIPFLLFPLLMATGLKAQDVSLNGEWDAGLGRNYNLKAQVPGVPLDPEKMPTERLWYKREINLPSGDWTSATLVLKGARFAPQVYVNGAKVSETNGGMGQTFHALKLDAVKPGQTVTLEISLAPLKSLPTTDASYIPSADHWRSNVSSCLWDDVVLRTHGATQVKRLTPFLDYASRSVEFRYELSGKSQNVKAKAEILDLSGKVLLEENKTVNGSNGSLNVAFGNKLKDWSPEQPNLYKVRFTLSDDKKILDQTERNFGVKNFEVRDKRFFLNGEEYQVRAGTVVWHRWMRDEEGRQLGYDTAWFKRAVIDQLKDRGANTLRFHLGNPPERFLDLCDKHGLLVQYEWSFFHGMPASKESLLEQWPGWLDEGLKHPSVSLIHPYNETHGKQLDTAWAALDEIVPNYPKMVLEERDVIHIHKYWWSLFENVGLYFDSAEQFPKAIMVDEFGGNYLDNKGDLGGYKTVKSAYFRFLGRSNTAEERLRHHAVSNARIAEYWRTLGAAGFSPFNILGSYEDGNHWYLGPLTDIRPMPVWNALTAAWSPRSLSIDMWDRNFAPGQEIDLPLALFNDEGKKAELNIRLTVEDRNGKIYSEQYRKLVLAGRSRDRKNFPLRMPERQGHYIIKAELMNRPATVKYPVYSDWEVRVFKAETPDILRSKRIGVDPADKELTAFLSGLGIETVPFASKKADLLLASESVWEKVKAGDKKTLKIFRKAIASGKSVVLLDAGPASYGKQYPKNDGSSDLGHLQGVEKVTNGKTETYDLVGGTKITFRELAEAESHIHAALADSSLWTGVPKENTWLWNGLRGGLIAPAHDMELSGLSQQAFVEQWLVRGAEEQEMKSDSYYAFELQGYYAFSKKKNDKQVQKKLRDKVIFLVEDAPALAGSVNPHAKINELDLVKAYRQSLEAEAENLAPLANCGKSLVRTPVALVDFGQGKGKLLVSQLLTAGRLAEGFGGRPEDKDLTRYDEVARQLVLNMMARALGVPTVGI
ncbi:hypothetical protein FUAX_29540 [Fulvitalea axinellae]|uniref:Glycoside hydrolase family 2 immunoglobulin-like beta-sandwich domain-containing protein n=1 Tax=Fulvitalea axinellae TaxID=1182444 RepID=A0AAU9CYH5_9BACT|nr:hypothetical protein FUAX_29540 [Fulvitalea axinellae]